MWSLSSLKLLATLLDSFGCLATLGCSDKLVGVAAHTRVTKLDPKLNYTLSKAFFLDPSALRPSSGIKFVKGICFFDQDLKYLKNLNYLLYQCALFWLSQGTLFLNLNRANFDHIIESFPAVRDSVCFIPPFFKLKKINPKKRLLLDIHPGSSLRFSFLERDLPSWSVIKFQELRLSAFKDKSDIFKNIWESISGDGVCISLGWAQLDDYKYYSLCEKGFVVISDSEAVCKTFDGVYVNPDDPLTNLLPAIERALDKTEIQYPALDDDYFSRFVTFVRQEYGL